MAQTYLQAGVYFVEPISTSGKITVDDAEYEIPSGYSFTIRVKRYMSLDSTVMKYTKLPNETVAMAKN
jgi:hypothetical protein